ncbi:hypothetical protein [Roseibium aggregatum]|uniref:hypothetical protein n=1 Tax=Roseibium aggregatum TaxID=187304 RepID=UPI001E328A4E|nr:hypothetical protein [Roseibium aggregatum]UES53949.1 hypothetical protein GFK88_29720 [Roseibium aggregatum]
MKLQPIVAAPGPTVQKPGRRAPVALWILDRALRRIARAGTVWLRLPDGETRRYGSGVLECAIALHDWPTLRASRSIPTSPWVRPGWTAR